MHGGNAKAVRDDQAPGSPTGKLIQIQDGLQALGVKGDWRSELPDLTLIVPVADVGRHESIGNRVVANLAAGDGDKGDQLDLPQFRERLVHDGDLLARQPVRPPVTGKVLGHRRHPAATARVHALDIGLTHLPHPHGIAAKGPAAHVALGSGLGIVQYVQARAQQEIDAHGRKLEAGDLAHIVGAGNIPGGAGSKWVGQRRSAAGDLRVGIAVTLMLHGDEKRDLDTATHGQRLKAIGQLGHLARSVCAIVEIGIGSQQDNTTHVILPDQRGDVAAGTGIAPLKGDYEKLAHPLFCGHG